MTFDEYTRYIYRRLGPAYVNPAFCAIEDAVDRLADALDNPTPAPLPAGWGTSPRRAPTAATYKPAHGGYPGEVKA